MSTPATPTVQPEETGSQENQELTETKDIKMNLTTLIMIMNQLRKLAKTRQQSKQRIQMNQRPPQQQGIDLISK